MKKSPFYEKRKQEEKKQVLAMYRKGLTMRHIGKVVGKSYQYVWLIVRHLNNPKYNEMKKVSKNTA